MSYVVWSIEMSLTEIQLDPYFRREFSPIYFFKFKILMAFTLYKLSLKLLNSVAESRICKKGDSDSIPPLYFAS